MTPSMLRLPAERFSDDYPTRSYAFSPTPVSGYNPTFHAIYYRHPRRVSQTGTRKSGPPLMGRPLTNRKIVSSASWLMTQHSNSTDRHYYHG
jgi:hypothetical protein